MSMVVERRSSASHAVYRRSASRGDDLDGGGLDDGGSGDDASDAHESPLASQSGELKAGASAEERREWVLLKLRSLVDAVRKVQASASAERDAGTNQGELVGDGSLFPAVSAAAFLACLPCLLPPAVCPSAHSCAHPPRHTRRRPLLPAPQPA